LVECVHCEALYEITNPTSTSTEEGIVDVSIAVHEFCEACTAPETGIGESSSSSAAVPSVVYDVTVTANPRSSPPHGPSARSPRAPREEDDTAELEEDGKPAR
jgi:hypothetical protein